MDPLLALSRACDEYEKKLTEVGAQRWGLPTPCKGWTVRDLADHLVSGNRFAVHALAGVPSGEARGRARAAGFDGDPLDVFRESADAQLAAFAEPGALERPCDHPLGQISGAEFALFRASDLTIHTWDLTRAIGADESLPDELVQVALAVFTPLAPGLAHSGVFGEGASGRAEFASPQARLLDLVGRRPER